MEIAELARLIDHTLLRPEATAEHVEHVVDEGRQLGCAAVCVNPARVAQVAAKLTGSQVLTCSVISFPFGFSNVEASLAQAHQAIADGAAEIDVVAPLHRIADHDGRGLRRDLGRFIDGIRGRAVVKVILETAAWDSQQIVDSCRAAVDAGADWVKTSTGFHPAGGASIHAVELLAANAGHAGVKASGGIRDLDTALAMIDAGATRLGCSATSSILSALAAADS